MYIIYDNISRFLLLQFGGFPLPFYLLGVFMLLLTPFYFYSLPALSSEYESTYEGFIKRIGTNLRIFISIMYIFFYAGSRPARHPGSLFKLIQIPSMLVIFLIIVVSSNAWSFLDPTLEPHLRQVRAIHFVVRIILKFTRCEINILKISCLYLHIQHLF